MTPPAEVAVGAGATALSPWVSLLVGPAAGLVATSIAVYYLWKKVQDMEKAHQEREDAMC